MTEGCLLPAGALCYPLLGKEGRGREARPAVGHLLGRVEPVAQPATAKCKEVARRETRLVGAYGCANHSGYDARGHARLRPDHRRPIGSLADALFLALPLRCGGYEGLGKRWSAPSLRLPPGHLGGVSWVWSQK